MSWLTKALSAPSAAAAMLGSSIAYIKGKTGLTVTDAQADKLVSKSQAATDKVEAILADLIDEIPGVPSIGAKLAAAAAIHMIDAMIAAAGESVKANN